MGQCGWFPLTSSEIHAWVQRHKHDLPRNLDELSQFPTPFRKVIVATVPPDIRVAWWREHLQSFLTESSALSEEQRDLVAQASESLSTFFSEPGAPGPTLRTFSTRLRSAFTRQEASEIFGVLGPPEPPGGLPIPADAIPHPGPTV
jgi:hypothetical protein